jgi:hypothetical protein
MILADLLYRWLLNGAALYRIIEMHYMLFDGINTTSRKVCFESFPQAVACALKGEIVSAKRKNDNRRRLLRETGIDTSLLTNIDLEDASLCALTAHRFLIGNFKTYGDREE